jgi:hypothetical protein
MFENNPGCVIGRTVHNEDLPGHAGAFKTFLAPLDKFAHSDFFIHSRDDDAQLYVSERHALRFKMFNAATQRCIPRLYIIQHFSFSGVGFGDVAACGPVLDRFTSSDRAGASVWIISSAICKGKAISPSK